MVRKIVSIFLLLIIFIGVTPVVSANTNQADRDAQCVAASQAFRDGMFTFVAHNLLGIAAFQVLDSTTSFLEETAITLTAGIMVKEISLTLVPGALLEPLEQTIDWIRIMWKEVVLWGIIASFLNLLAGLLIETGIALNLTLNTGNPLISYGGRIILQIANLGFVISIIFVGIATILRLKQDALSADKLLIKLIIGIILVNLTIPITLSIAGIGTRITDAMYRSSAPCPVNITAQFTAWGLRNRFEALLTGDVVEENIATEQIDVPDVVEEEADGHLEAGLEAAERQTVAFQGMIGRIMANFIAIWAGSAMSFIAFLTFFALAVFLVIRFVILMILITFSPLIWFGFIFSELKISVFGNIWTGWWNQFLKWTFFGPVIILFIAFVSEYLYSIEVNPIILPGSPGLVQNFIQIAQLFVVLLISSIGLYATYKFSGVAGSAVIQAASGAVGFVANGAQRMAKKVQIGADMHAKEAELKGNTGRAKAFNILSKASQATGAGLNLNKSSSLLGRVGIKPAIKAPDEEKIKKDILMRELKYGKPKPGIGIRVGYQPSIAGVHLTDEPWRIKRGYIENPTKALVMSEKDAQSLSDDDKKDFISAIREVQKISYSLTPEELASLRKHEKTFASDLATATMKDVEIPTVLTPSGAMTPDGLDKAKNMLQLAQESIRDIVNNGMAETIEKGTKTILALENELKINPASFNREEISKLQILRRNFDEKIADYILDSIDPLTNPESVFNLSNKNLSYISKSGTTLDKQKIDESLMQLNFRRVGGHLNTIEEKELARVDTKINVYKGKHEW